MKIDQRTHLDIEEKIEALSKSYCSQWRFDRENPDIGSTIALLFALQAEENIERINSIPDRWHMDFVNLLDLSLLPAKPAKSIILLPLAQDTIPGTFVPKGTRFLADTDDGGTPVVFESEQGIYVTSSRIRDIFMTDFENGSIQPLLGEIPAPRIVEEDQLPESLQESAEEETEPNTALHPFTLFGAGKGIGMSALLFYHDSIFDVTDNDIYVRILGNDALVQRIAGGEFRFLYVSAEGLKDYEKLRLLEDGHTFVLQKSEKEEHLFLDDHKYGLLALVSKLPVVEEMAVDSIRFSSVGAPAPAEHVTDGSTELSVDTFAPFGDTLSLYSECYIGHDSYFGKANALVTVSFHLNIEQHRIQIPRAAEDDSLRIIKRRPRAIRSDMPADAHADGIILEYFNGIGWRRLQTIEECSFMFQEERVADITLSFRCPEDWRQTEVGAVEQRFLRMVLLKSENCYLRPAIHYYPVLSDLRISYSYENDYTGPQRVFSITGTKKREITGQVASRYTAFAPIAYKEDALYIGLNHRPQEGPVSLFFHLQEKMRFFGIKCKFEYSTTEGFKQMKVMDYTANFTRTGIVMFLPQPDMHQRILEGKKRYWIRIVRLRQQEEDDTLRLPRIRDIGINAVMVSNIETVPENDLYVDDPQPDMTFSLGVPGILNLDVWVNESGRHSYAAMQELMREMPDDVRAETDVRGNLLSFYVRWKEVESLEDAEDKRSYSLDRINSILTFGDGIHTEYPRVTDDVAVRVRVYRCTGSRGNVAQGRIRSPLGNLLYINEVRNPIRAFGGSDMESLPAALRRGAGILHSRGRLVSAGDFEKAILSYSDNVERAKCVIGQTPEGKPDAAALSILVLMKDYADGSYSFHRIEEKLKEYLLSSCELTLTPENLYICEPIFLSVSVDIWASIFHMEDSFEVQGIVKRCMDAYLDPVKNGQEEGWDFGTLPKKTQIMMKLNVLKSWAQIHKIAVNVSYMDKQGTHEVDLESFSISPFMIIRSGTHRVHIMHNYDNR